MKSRILIPLTPTPEQHQRLVALQQAFAEVCNAIAPTVAQTRVWNRVALHHMLYKALRERYPALGSQMVCNAIYAVSRLSRVVYQHPASPFLASRQPAGPLPVLRFVDTAPVVFDRHTLSLKDGRLSMFTLGGRVRFELEVREADERTFRDCRLLEVELTRDPRERFTLRFSFETQPADAFDGLAPDAADVEADAGEAPAADALIPPYVQVEETP